MPTVAPINPRSSPTGSRSGSRAGAFDLATARSLKKTLEGAFAETVSIAAAPISVLESLNELLPENRFVQSLRDVPLRHLDNVMAARDSDTIGQALRGRALASPMSGIVAQSGARATPRMSVGYHLADDNAFSLEVRLQHADVQSVIHARTLVEKLADGKVPIGILSKVSAHGGVAVHPGALNNDPLTLGSSVAHVTGVPGTLGLFVTSGKSAGFLSCSHVLANCGGATAGDAIHHPAEADDGLNHRRIGTLKRFVDLRGDGPFTMDAAFAELFTTINAVGNSIPVGQGWPSEGRSLGGAIVGPLPMPRAVVAKIGRSSGYTTGVVSLENVGPIDIYMNALGANVTVQGLTEVRWDSLNKPFSNLGDSGSVVYIENSRELVGIVIAGGIAEIEKVKVGVSYVCPLAPILNAWGLSLS